MALAAGLAVAASGPSAAVGTELFDQTFVDSTLTGTSPVTLPTVGSGTNVACLTASSDTSATPLPGCQSPAIDTSGSGALRLTSASDNKVGALLGATSLPTASGLDISFDTHQYGGTDADGIAFVLGGVNPSTQVPPSAAGPSGGALGYSANSSSNGYSYGYLGIGFDVYGNFLNPTHAGGTGCTNPSYATTSEHPNEVTIRGPGNGLAGYCIINSTGNPALGMTQPVLTGSDRSGSEVPVEVTINPSSGSITNQGGYTVAANSWHVAFTGVGQSAQTMTGLLPSASSFMPASWVDANGIPKQLSFGWVASTGGFNQTHEIARSTNQSVTPVPVLSSTVTYSGTTAGSSGSGTYAVTPTLADADISGDAITVSGSVPSGMALSTPTGTDWTCTVDTSTTYTCTTTGTSFTAGTTLPTITAPVTISGSVTYSGIQSGGTVRTTSPDAMANLVSTTTINATAPAATASAATSITTTTATLNGSVIPNGGATTSSFKYSTDSSVVASGGGTDSAVSGTIAASAGATAISSALSGLSPGTTYYFRAYATNSAGTGNSTSGSFTTVTGAALNPTFGTPTATADGFTVQITNYDAAYTWGGTATASGTVAINGTGLVTVTGVAPGTSSTATITTTRTGYNSGTGDVTASSGAGLTLSAQAQVAVGVPARVEATVGSMGRSNRSTGPSGTVTIMVGGNLFCTATIVNGVGSCKGTPTSRGRITFTGLFQGSGSSVGATASATTSSTAATVAVTAARINMAAVGQCRATATVYGVDSTANRTIVVYRKSGRNWVRAGTTKAGKNKAWKVVIGLMSANTTIRATDGRTTTAWYVIQIPKRGC